MQALEARFDATGLVLHEFARRFRAFFEPRLKLIGGNVGGFFAELVKLGVNLI